MAQRKVTISVDLRLEYTFVKVMRTLSMRSGVDEGEIASIMVASACREILADQGLDETASLEQVWDACGPMSLHLMEADNGN